MIRGLFSPGIRLKSRSANALMIFDMGEMGASTIPAQAFVDGGVQGVIQSERIQAQQLDVPLSGGMMRDPFTRPMRIRIRTLLELSQTVNGYRDVLPLLARLDHITPGINGKHGMPVPLVPDADGHHWRTVLAGDDNGGTPERVGSAGFPEAEVATMGNGQGKVFDDRGCGGCCKG